ncbi:hypothetical protein GW764_02010 [Candidatus Parcubacteria bacterium]|nr:hypothetical protein [Candidatus Parcubacteria bacterium]
MDFRKQSNKDLATSSNTNLTIFKDESFVFLYKKTERLSTAIYLITNLMSVQEPIKWQLRKTTLNLLDNVMSLSNATMSSRESVLRDISQKLFQLISLYNVAFRSGFISEMNYRIVNEELNKIANFVDEFDMKENESRTRIIKDDFFAEPAGEIIKDNVFYKGQQKQKGHQSMSDRNVFEEDEQNSAYSSVIKKTPKKTLTENKTTNKTTNKIHERNKRREEIINIIKQKKDVSVKDISAIIKDTSEKTLQRELVSMVEEGVLEKEGERRWSRYMIKGQ